VINDAVAQQNEKNFRRVRECSDEKIPRTNHNALNAQQIKTQSTEHQAVTAIGWRTPRASRSTHNNHLDRAAH
jgi:hypothetical protein